MRLLDRLLRRPLRDASRVVGRRRVALACRISSADDVLSPVTGVRAALIRGTVLEQQTYHGGDAGGTDTRYRVLGRVLYGPEALTLVADGLSIHVPTSTLRLGLVEDHEDGEILAWIPPPLAVLVSHAQPAGPVAYRESLLIQGDPVILQGTVEPIAPEAGYRDAPGPADLRLVPNGHATLREPDSR